MQKIALITGVTRNMGLGYATAQQLKALGYTVVITGRNLATVSALAAAIGVEAKEVDITDEVSVQNLAASIQQEYGKLDVLINNAGAYFDQGGEVLSTAITFVKDALDTNLLGAWRMVKAFVPLLQKAGSGRIVNVSSGAGSFSDPVFGLEHHQGKVPAYAITKLALNGLTVKLALELKEHNIKVNAVCPGFVATYPGTEAWGARPVEEGAKGIVWAATLPDNGPSGQFFRDGEPIAW